MDRDSTGPTVLNEAIWTVNLAGLTEVTLSFWQTDWGDGASPLPDDFSGSFDGDGVAISDDGVNWRKIAEPSDVSVEGRWEQVWVDLDVAAAAAGMSLTSSFQIKFQQYDFLSLPSRGRGFDQLSITTPTALAPDWFAFDLADGESATVAVTGLNGSSLALDLFASDGSTLLASGTSAVNVSGVVRNFVDSTDEGGDDTYLARISGADTNYSLFIGRGADLDTEPNDQLSPTAQDFWPSQSVFGHFGQVLGNNQLSEQRLTATDPGFSDEFGSSVSISGDKAVIGVPFDDDNGSSSGAAYVFEFDGTDWHAVQKLLAADGAFSDNFGLAVAIDGDWIAIAAPFDDDNGASSSGSVYVYEFDGSQWNQQQKLTADVGTLSGRFGSSLSISGENLVVGEPGNDDAAPDGGAAYVFGYDGNQWTQPQKLLPDDPEFVAEFGMAVAIDGETILVGAPGKGRRLF